jgi:predicted alpha/beta hydrolase family esterase
MKKQVLFIQGAGEGAYEEDEKLAASLQDALGTEYQVSYPQMPNEESPEDEAWITQISKELAALDGKVILVGHSAGGAVLLKYLLKEHVAKPIAGIFLISIPYWGPEDEEDDKYTLHEGFASQLPIGVPIFLYHSRDDEWVPFAHLEMYAEQIPQATIRTFDGRGHQFNNDLSEVAADILSSQDLHQSQSKR